MNRTAALAPVLFIAAANAATVTIDNFSVTESITGYSYNNGLTSNTLADGTTRSVSVSPWSGGTATLGISNGTLVTNSAGGYNARIDYNFVNSISLLGGATSPADVNVGLYVATTSSIDVPFTVWFFNNQYEASAYWEFSAVANNAGLYTANLDAISAFFAWNEVDSIRIEYGTTAGASVSLGGDGQGFRATAVPEASTYGLVLGGLALAVGVARRRRK